MKATWHQKTTPGPDTVRICRHLAGLLVSAVVALAAVILSPAGYAVAAEKPNSRAAADSLQSVLYSPPEELPLFDSTSTLADYLEVAVQRSPRLRAAYHRWVADLKKSDHVGALPNPVFSYAYFVENVETRVGPQEQRFGVRQSFPWFGTLGAQEDMAFAQSQASYQQFEATRYELFYDVKAAYYDYYVLGQSIAIARDNLELLTFWESVARSKYKVGLKQHPDVIKAQVELGKLEDHLITLQEQVAPTAARLKAILNLPDSIMLPVPQSIDVTELPLAEDSVISVIAQNNPGLRALERIVDSRRAGEQLAARQSMPSFSIGVDYIQTGDAINPSMAESGKDPWMIGAGISLPIWFGKNGARKDEAEARRRAAEYNLDETENRLMAMTRRLLFEYADALRKVRLYRDGLVPKAEQSLNASYASYQAGETDFLNVLDAQRALLDFQLTVAREQARLATRRAQLEMLSGTNLHEFEKP